MPRSSRFSANAPRASGRSPMTLSSWSSPPGAWSAAQETLLQGALAAKPPLTASDVHAILLQVAANAGAHRSRGDHLQLLRVLRVELQHRARAAAQQAAGEREREVGVPRIVARELGAVQLRAAVPAGVEEGAHGAALVGYDGGDGAG